MDDGAGEAGVAELVEEGGVEDDAGGGFQAEGYVGEADDGVAVGEFFGGLARAFGGFEGVFAVFFDAGGDGGDEGGEEDGGIFQAVLIRQIADAFGDGEFSGSGAGHGVLFV